MMSGELTSPSRPKATASIMQQTAARSKGVAPSTDFDFNLGVTKMKVMKSMDDHVPPLFRKFYNGQLFDRLLQTCLLYLTTMFQLERVVSAMERSRKQHLEGYNPYVVAQRIRELEEEVTSLKTELSPMYSLVILQFSSYEKPQQDRRFFEALYEALTAIMEEAFERLKQGPRIQQELGLLFRSKHFNIASRKHAPPRSVDTLSVKELYALKNETHNRALNARMLSSLFEKPQGLSVTVASVTNSPLVSQYVMSPIVARSMMKDPEQRASILKPATTASSEHHAKRRDLSTVFKSAAMLRGVNPDKLAADMAAQKMKMSDTSDIGVMAAEKSRKSENHRASHTLIAPEALGLPPDETFNFLTLMKRYVLYGPSLGLQNVAAPPSTTGTAHQSIAGTAPVGSMPAAVILNGTSGLVSSIAQRALAQHVAG